MPADGTPLPIESASFDVSSQYVELRRAFVPIFVVVGVGFVLVEVLYGFSITRDYPHASTTAALAPLILIAACFVALVGFLVWLLWAREVQQIRVDDVGVHVVRLHGGTVDHEWADRALHLEFREHAPRLGVRARPPPEHVFVVGRGFPFDLKVPFGVYEAALAQALSHRIAVATWTEEHHGRFGTHYWGVTAVGGNRS